jgi:hypothetical protein
MKVYLEAMPVSRRYQGWKRFKQILLRYTSLTLVVELGQKR